MNVILFVTKFAYLLRFHSETINPGYALDLACNSAPCQNNGQCKPLATGGFECACAAGFEGTTCSASKQEQLSFSAAMILYSQQLLLLMYLTGMQSCKPDTCKNGGTCLDDPGLGYVCLCDTGFSGKNCDTGSS